jgi:hypothetical protein
VFRTIRLPIFLYAFVIILLIPSAFAESSKKEYIVDKVPGWVLKQQYNINSPNKDAQAVQYLLIDDQRRLLSDIVNNPPQYFKRFAFRLLNHAGLSQHSQLEISFNPSYQTLHLHSLKVIRNGQIRELINQVYVRIVQQEQQLDLDIHDGRITAVLIPEDIRVGDIIDYSYSIKGNNPIFGNYHFGSVALEWKVPVKNMILRVLTDSDLMQFLSIGANANLKQKRYKGINEYIVIRSNVAQATDDGETSPEYSPFAWLDFSEYGSWKALNKWAKRLYSIDNNNQNKVRELAKKLRNNSKDNVDFITKALFFVQNDIRYIGLELGENSHLPRSPSEVLKKRYGDCKDKSLLLATLLNLEGFHAWPALVSTSLRYGIEQDLPNPGVFDHVITLVEFQGMRYWLDGTSLYQAGRLDDLGFSDYGYALVVGHSNPGLQRMYPNQTLSSKTEVSEDIISTHFDKPVLLKIKSSYSGKSAELQRYLFQTQSIDEIQRSYFEFYNRFYDAISIESPLVYDDDQQRNRFVIYETYKIDDYWKHQIRKCLVRFIIYPISIP